MSLPHLIKYIYNNGSDEVIRRGKKIFYAGNIELLGYDELLGTVVFRIKDDAYNIYYKVNIARFREQQTLALRCTCPYNIGEICKHEAAALFRLQEMVDKNLLGEREFLYNQQHTVIKMKQLDIKMIRMLSSSVAVNEAENYLRTNTANIIEAGNERVVAEMVYRDEPFKVVIQKNEERNFDTSCNCHTETTHPLCVHKIIVFKQLIAQAGAGYFDTIRNLDKEKNKLLALYGYSLEDDINGKFEFTYKDGKPFLRVMDSSIKRVSMPVPAPVLNRQIRTQAEDNSVAVEEENVTRPTLKLGIVISGTSQQYPYIQVDAIQGSVNEESTAYTGRIEKIDLSKFINTEPFDETDKMLVQQLRKFLPGEVDRYLSRNSPFSGIWENIIQQHDDELPEETRHLIIEYLYPKYRKLFSDIEDNNFIFFLPPHKSFTTANLQGVTVSAEAIEPSFAVSFHDDTYELICQAVVNGTLYKLSENQVGSPLLFKKEDSLYVWRNPEDIKLIEAFLPGGSKMINKDDWQKQLSEFILPISKKYPVQFHNIKKEEVKEEIPEARLMLREKGDYLLLQPFFSYRGHEVKQSDTEKIILPQGDKLLIIYRNYRAESNFIKKIEALHSGFIRTETGDTLALKGTEVLKNNWFFLFSDALKEMDVPVYGFDALKNFRFNTAKPSTKIHISSNTDWFDARVDIHFGSQKITIADVKKALANKQQFVALQDGTFGILPEEWIKKYALLFRVGEGKATNIKLSRYHFSIIEELYEQRDEEELVFRLEEKYESLKDNYAIAQVPAPLHLQPVLRPYQTHGFQWLNYLNDVKWGGILADDMGLGKTVQALSFLHHLQQKNGKLRALVACPTTLIYNWENEIKKFTPSLNYYIHHGSNRAPLELTKESNEVVITSYGTLRSDIKLFMDVPFDYVILDESQAIKNPASKIAKAVCLLNSRNRLCMSGTPLQNNTFDIYAQMNFLNPGMLGSMEFFRQEFAVPIDKFGEKEQKEHLRKLLFPFILRRTKEQVAKDLPEKLEMILFCEMGEEQRKIYDAYRNDYRDKILGVVAEQGIQKSQLTVLQGLMKLRQICDSPAIMKEEEKFPNVSVKLDEIGREITENIGDHKALIFSQFLGMLGLIRQKLEDAGIAYEYFDGSTGVNERQRAIDRFQNDDECRVFLISLKAGGVGLNLTAADYVYIVDPWWNPAVEQQAIDRTHRIGQTKNIFAYRMICRDTVEDKILKLQEKKRLLAADLITDDTGFVKSLSKEDIEYLFS